MIAALTGTLTHVKTQAAWLQVGPILYQLMVPAADEPSLNLLIGQEMTFHTLMYLEGDPNRGNLEPRLIGFARPEDRAFFERFTTVKGIGPKTALRALTVAVGKIAAAIEGRDTKFLVGLDGIGKRTAELIVAELSGKVADFATAASDAASTRATKRSTAEEDAIAGLVALGERRSDAELLLEKVQSQMPELKATGELLREMLRARQTPGNR